MSLILDGTNGLSDVDGSAATPAIRGTDANTGIFFPAADTIAFAEGGVESMRIDSSGRVGIGETTPANTLAIKAATATVRLDSSTGTNAVYSQFANTAGSFYVGRDNSAGTTFGTAYGSYLYSEGAYPLISWVNGTERMRITSGGYFKASNNSTFYSSTGSSHEFNSNASDYALMVSNRASSSPFGVLVRYTASDPNNADSQGFGFYNDSAGVWVYRIYSNGTVAARSDIRWKKNVETTRDGYLEDVSKLRVVKYNWYNHENNAPKELGFIAQEVEQVFPGLVQTDPVVKTVETTNEDGTVTTEQIEDGESKSIKTSVLVPILVKAIQELNTDLANTKLLLTEVSNKVEAQAAEIAELKAKP